MIYTFGMRLFLSTAIVLSLSMVPALAQVSVRLERLQMIFDGNVYGAVFVKHCDKRPITDYPVYIENAQATMLALAEEMMVAGRGILTPEQIEKSIRERQRDGERAMDDFYKKNGCETKQAASAKKHFDMFNDTSPEQMDEFLADVENR
ncbi:hypothetical protein N9Z27_01375 [Alphaproteobacteria bacterium]|nr:hypothetical protein [Alphaproteobacteria bacterium]